MIVESTLNSSSLIHLIESTGRRAVLKGIGGASGKGNKWHVLNHFIKSHTVCYQGSGQMQI